MKVVRAAAMTEMTDRYSIKNIVMYSAVCSLPFVNDFPAEKHKPK